MLGTYHKYRVSPEPREETKLVHQNEDLIVEYSNYLTEDDIRVKLMSFGVYSQDAEDFDIDVGMNVLLNKCITQFGSGIKKSEVEDMYIAFGALYKKAKELGLPLVFTNATLEETIKYILVNDEFQLLEILAYNVDFTIDPDTAGFLKTNCMYFILKNCPILLQQNYRGRVRTFDTPHLLISICRGKTAHWIFADRRLYMKVYAEIIKPNLDNLITAFGEAECMYWLLQKKFEKVTDILWSMITYKIDVVRSLMIEFANPVKFAGYKSFIDRMKGKEEIVKYLIEHSTFPVRSRTVQDFKRMLQPMMDEKIAAVFQ